MARRVSVTLFAESDILDDASACTRLREMFGPASRDTTIFHLQVVELPVLQRVYEHLPPNAPFPLRFDTLVWLDGEQFLATPPPPPTQEGVSSATATATATATAPRKPSYAVWIESRQPSLSTHGIVYVVGRADGDVTLEESVRLHGSPFVSQHAALPPELAIDSSPKLLDTLRLVYASTRALSLTRGPSSDATRPDAPTYSRFTRARFEANLRETRVRSILGDAPFGVIVSEDASALAALHYELARAEQSDSAPIELFDAYYAASDPAQISRVFEAYSARVVECLRMVWYIIGCVTAGSSASLWPWRR